MKKIYQFTIGKKHFYITGKRKNCEVIAKQMRGGKLYSDANNFNIEGSPDYLIDADTDIAHMSQEIF